MEGVSSKRVATPSAAGAVRSMSEPEKVRKRKAFLESEDFASEALSSEAIQALKIIRDRGIDRGGPKHFLHLVNVLSVKDSHGSDPFGVMKVLAERGVHRKVCFPCRCLPCLPVPCDAVGWTWRHR